MLKRPLYAPRLPSVRARLRILARHGLDPAKSISIPTPAFASQYDNACRSVVIDGRERFRGRVDEVLLRQLSPRNPGNSRRVT